MTRTASHIIVVSAFVAVAAAANVDLAAQKQPDPNSNRPATPVLDVLEDAKEPFVLWDTLHFAAPPQEEVPKYGQPGNYTPRAVYMETEEYRVPAGKVLVLEYANAVACGGPKEKMSIGLLTSYERAGMQAKQELKIVLQEQGVFAEPDGAYMHFGASQQMRVYIPGGQSFRFTAWRSGAPTHAEAQFWVTGYLVPAVRPGR